MNTPAKLRKTLSRTCFLSFLFTVSVGCLLHFAFALSGGNTVVGTFVPVNESVWEHEKLLLTPALLFAFFEYFLCGKSFPAFPAAKVYAIFAGMASILFLHYTLVGAFGESSLPADIAVFVFSCGLTSLLTGYLTEKASRLASDGATILALSLLAFLLFLFLYFTFHPPAIELFRDPLSEDFGIPELYAAQG